MHNNRRLNSRPGLRPWRRNFVTSWPPSRPGSLVAACNQDDVSYNAFQLPVLTTCLTDAQADGNRKGGQRRRPQEHGSDLDGCRAGGPQYYERYLTCRHLSSYKQVGPDSDSVPGLS